MLEHGIAPATGVGYEIDNSLRFNDDDSAYLSRTPSSEGNRKTWTWSAWVKRGDLGTEQSVSICVQWSNIFNIYFRSDDKLSWDVEYGSTHIIAYTDRVFRDTSAWYHIVATLDTTNSTASERLKIWVNGELQTFPNYTYGSGYIAQNSLLIINSTTRSHNIGRRGDNPVGQYLDGYMAETYFIDGQALDPSNFGETGDYGEWKPIKYTGTYGTNGFYLDFENSGSLGADVSGNGNNWTPTNLVATDQMLDSPTNNFCTMNPLKQDATTFQEGNLEVSNNTGECATVGTMNVSSGKWYWEFYCNSTNAQSVIGVANENFDVNGYTGSDTNSWGYYDNNSGAVFHNRTTVTTLGLYANGDIIQVAIDADTNKCWWGKNGTWLASGDPANGTNPVVTNLSGALTPSCSSATGTVVTTLNAGQDSSFAGNKTAQGNTDGNGYGDFYYTPPTGYLALCTQNLPDPTVIPSEHFNTVLYTGNASTNAITGVGFQPDLLWTKGRSIAEHHCVYDAVRTRSAGNLKTNLTNAEAYQNKLASFDTDGFTLNTGDMESNNNGSTYVSWNWKANGSGSSNTNGSITSTVSANQDAGFSIVSYTGTGVAATVGHGLSQAPEMVIVKNRDVVKNWAVGHTGFLASQWMQLEATSGVTNAATVWNSTYPSASSISIGTASVTNANGENYIAYAFHSVEGFSKVGSYTGNGSTDGTFVFTGGRPAYLMVKRSDSTSNWSIVDDPRDLKRLHADESVAEYTGGQVEFLSNGFKLRDTNTNFNASGGTYVFVCFFEHPFKHTNAR